MVDGTAQAEAFRARADRAAAAEIASLAENAIDAHTDSCARGDPGDIRERAALVETLRTGSAQAAAIARRSSGWEASVEPMVSRRPLGGDPTRPPVLRADGRLPPGRPHP